MREGTPDGDAGSSLELFREELARAHHLDWVALTTFALLAVPAMALVAFHEAVEHSGGLSVTALTAVALSAAAAHMLVRNASDYWVSLTVASQSIKGSGLADRGVFPHSLMVYPPHTLGDFGRRLVYGSRGGLLVAYLVLGALGGFSVLHHYLALLAAFVLGGIIPLLFAALSIWVNFSRLRHLLLALAKEMELGGDGGEDMAERHCSLAETMVLLRPPRIREAISFYRIALELQPGHPRALEGLHRLTATAQPRAR